MATRSLLRPSRTSDLIRYPDRGPFSTLYAVMDRMFDDFTNSWSSMPLLREAGLITPSVDIVERNNLLEITVDLPGIDERDVDVEVEDGVLTLRAQRRHEREERDENLRWHVSERSFGTFLRRIPLPADVDQDNIDATFDKGQLKIVVPLSDRQGQVKRIEVRPGPQQTLQGQGDGQPGEMRAGQQQRGQRQQQQRPGQQRTEGSAESTTH